MDSRLSFRVNKVPVLHHHVVRLTLDTNRVLEISAGHPLADRRKVGDLSSGDKLGHAHVLKAELVPYRFAFTYDILPASDTGTYLAGGELIGSTLFSR
ncbi:MAG TPA: hypothetical protein VH062_28915 [Polyangiaceae bacterium]|jgi:hypothetical protein|nr:hypothetical protein [Polyangiaceae bacterium]